MSRYSFEESIRDDATLPLHFEARLVEHRVDQAAIDEAFANITGELSEEDLAEPGEPRRPPGVLLKAPEHVRARRRTTSPSTSRRRSQPNGFKAQVVVFDREACVLYKEALDEILPPECERGRDVGRPRRHARDWRSRFGRSKDDEEKLLDRFRDPADPLQILIVTVAPAHRLRRAHPAGDVPRQADEGPQPAAGDLPHQPAVPGEDARPDRRLPRHLRRRRQVADFDEHAVRQVITNIEELKKQLPEAIADVPRLLPRRGPHRRRLRGPDRRAGVPARQRSVATPSLPTYSVLAQLWEAISPDPMLGQYRDDYRWLTQVYESVQPPSGNGKLLWHALGAKTVELIHENIHVEAVRDDLETLVLDAEILEELTELQRRRRPRKWRSRSSPGCKKHAGNPQVHRAGRTARRRCASATSAGC